MKNLMTPLLLSVVCAGCSQVEVHTDYNPGIHFADYHTYAWGNRPQSSNPLMVERIINEMDVALAAHGMKRIEEGAHADATLFVHMTTHEQPRIDTYTTGGGWGWGRYGGMGMGMGGMSTSTVTFDTIGTLIVDIFDSKSQQPLWHASAEGAVSEDAKEDQAELREAVQKMFLDFPPDSVKKP